MNPKHYVEQYGRLKNVKYLDKFLEDKRQGVSEERSQTRPSGIGFSPAKAQKGLQAVSLGTESETGLLPVFSIVKNFL